MIQCCNPYKCVSLAGNHFNALVNTIREPGDYLYLFYCHRLNCIIPTLSIKLSVGSGSKYTTCQLQAGLNFNGTRQPLSSADTASVSVANRCIDKVPFLHHTEGYNPHVGGMALCSKVFVTGCLIHIGRMFQVARFPHIEKMQVYKILDNLLT